MDVIAHADGDIGEDVGCLPLGKGQQKERHEVHHDDVLVHRQDGKPGGGVLYAACRWKVIPLRHASDDINNMIVFCNQCQFMRVCFSNDDTVYHYILTWTDSMNNPLI